MAIRVRLNPWQLAFALLCVLWLMRVVTLAADDYPLIAASASTTLDDIRADGFVLYDLPAAATEAEAAAIHARVLADLAGDKSAGRATASARTLSGTNGVDLGAHAADHAWLASQLSVIRERAWRRAQSRFYSTWIAVWALPAGVLALVLLGLARLRRRAHPR